MRRPHWRKTTWVILVFNAVILVWLLAGLGPPPNCAREATEALREECESGRAFGWTTAAGITVFFWIAGDVMLGALWLVALSARPTGLTATYDRFRRPAVLYERRRARNQLGSIRRPKWRWCRCKVVTLFSTRLIPYLSRTTSETKG